MKREESLLNLICIIAAAGFFALIAYDLFAGGSIISTDGLFFIVVPLVFALSFLAVPGIDILSRLLEKRKTRREVLLLNWPRQEAPQRLAWVAFKVRRP